MAEWNLLEAVTRAFAWELGVDENVVVLGEDVGVNGGVFRATDGLQETFGAERVIDTPLAESVIVGMAIGMAISADDGIFRCHTIVNCIDACPKKLNPTAAIETLRKLTQKRQAFAAARGERQRSL